MMLKKRNTQPLDHQGHTVGFEVITPDLATEYLNTMPGNRPLSNKSVRYLVQQAEAGKFYDTVAPLHFDAEGRLRNGQHRMWMVIDSQMPQQFLVVRGATEEEIDALDIGKRRTPADTLALDGYANTKWLAGALQNLWMYEHGIVPGHSRSMFNTANAPGMTNHNMREYAPMHPDMVYSVEYLRATPSVRLLGPPTMLAFVHFCTVQSSPVKSTSFWDSIAKQNFWGQNDPAFRIYDRLTRSKGGNRTNLLTPMEVGALSIKAWNNWVQGKDTMVLRWQAPGSRHNTKEGFPRVRGYELC